MSVNEPGSSLLSQKSATKIDLVILSEVRRVGRSRRTCIQGMRLCSKSMTQETRPSPQLARFGHDPIQLAARGLW